MIFFPVSLSLNIIKYLYFTFACSITYSLPLFLFIFLYFAFAYLYLCFISFLLFGFFSVWFSLSLCGLCLSFSVFFFISVYLFLLFSVSFFILPFSLFCSSPYTTSPILLSTKSFGAKCLRICRPRINMRTRFLLLIKST